MTGSVPDQIANLQRQFGGLITKSWSANFEDEPYPEQPALILEDSIKALAATHHVDDHHAPFVNLVTPGELGDPQAYLVPALTEAMAGKVRFEYEGECGCGGHVLRAWRLL